MECVMQGLEGSSLYCISLCSAIDIRTSRLHYNGAWADVFGVML